MSTAAIRVQNIGKRYVLGRALDPHRTIREAVVEGAAGMFRKAGSLLGRRPDGDAPEEFWALRDVSFEVQRGEAIGVIGGNGAGKSTLLKLLSRITAPTEGAAMIRGRVGSLLEVGTGFHPDLTGRENVFLNGAILGMRRSEIARKFDEIVAFAEVERFIDTPVKRYSSGMYLRLAFAVAAHLEPEILLVDEVLAVGDAAFQKKCLGKMEDVTSEGRTVLFVSHNLPAVQTLCRRAVWLREGRLAADGPVGDIVSQYLQGQQEATEHVWDDPATAPGNDRVRLRRVALTSADGTRVAEVATSTPLRLAFEYWNLQPGADLSLSLHVFNEHGLMVFNALPVTEQEWQGRPFPAGLFRDVCEVPGNLLNAGRHSVELLVVQGGNAVLYRHEHAIVFDVHDTLERSTRWFGRWAGAVRPILPWSTELLVAGEARALEPPPQ